MKRKIKSLQKASKVQSLKKDLAQWRLGAANREVSALEESRVEIIKALNGEAASFGPLAAIAARHAQALERKIDAAVRHRSAAQGDALDQGAKAKAIGEALAKARHQHEKHVERKTLGELIEQCLGASAQATDKVS